MKVFHPIVSLCLWSNVQNLMLSRVQIWMMHATLFCTVMTIEMCYEFLIYLVDLLPHFCSISKMNLKYWKFKVWLQQCSPAWHCINILIIRSFKDRQVSTETKVYLTWMQWRPFESVRNLHIPRSSEMGAFLESFSLENFLSYRILHALCHIESFPLTTSMIIIIIYIKYNIPYGNII